jgi:hypothetical protein
MSTHVNDFASAVAVHAAVAPSVQSGALNGDAVDLIDSDGECFAVQQIGSFEESNTWTGRIEQSADGTSGWAAISGAAFTAVTEGPSTQAIRFTRTQRYVRYAASVVGSTSELSLAVLIGESKKTF